MEAAYRKANDEWRDKHAAIEARVQSMEEAIEDLKKKNASLKRQLAAQKGASPPEEENDAAKG